MNPFFDMHTHLLAGVDDGAKNEDEMFAMLDMAYADGTRAICLTPHFTPYLYGDTYDTSQKAFEILTEYAEKTYPELKLFLGHELGFFGGCFEALAKGRCRTIAGSRYLLVDFPENIGFYEIDQAIGKLRANGYHPVLAHAERYPSLCGKEKWLSSFCESGGIIQVNASSAVGGWGRIAKGQWKKLVKSGLVHIVSSDGHNLTGRQPKISVCMPYLEKWCHPETVKALTWENAWHIVNNEVI